MLFGLTWSTPEECQGLGEPTPTSQEVEDQGGRALKSRNCWRIPVLGAWVTPTEKILDSENGLQTLKTRGFTALETEAICPELFLSRIPEDLVPIQVFGLPWGGLTAQVLLEPLQVGVVLDGHGLQGVGPVAVVLEHVEARSWNGIIVALGILDHDERRPL